MHHACTTCRVVYIDVPDPQACHVCMGLQNLENTFTLRGLLQHERYNNIVAQGNIYKLSSAWTCGAHWAEIAGHILGLFATASLAALLLGYCINNEQIKLDT